MQQNHLKIQEKLSILFEVNNKGHCSDCIPRSYLGIPYFCSVVLRNTFCVSFEVNLPQQEEYHLSLLYPGCTSFFQ